jgi:DNA-binding XRE family transcriptional regulator
MSKTKTKYPNSLLRYRERLGFTQDQLAHLVGCRRAQTIRRIESGSTLPGVMTVMRLSSALRTPVEFLYQETFMNLRDEVRAKEERMPKGQQGVLPLPV